MADLSQLEAALVKADAAGNTEDARALAGEIRRMRNFSAIKSEGQVEKPPTPYHPSGETALTPQEEVLGNPMVRGIIGAARPVIGAGQLAANVVGLGKPVNEAIAETNRNIQRGRDYIGSKGFDAFQFGGQLASPVYLAAGGLPNAATTLGRIGQGASVGAATGAMELVTDPNDYWGQKALQTGTGAVLGGTVPAMWEAGKAVGRGVRNVLQPYMGEAGAEKAAGRLANTVANSKAEEIIKQLQNPQVMVPGSSPTAAQAAQPAGSAEFAALQKLAAEKDPSKYAAIEQAQNQARIKALQGIGQTPEALQAAEAARSADAARNYGVAFAQTVKGDPELAKMAQNPYFKDALGDATKLAQANGISPKEDLTQFLHYVKVSLDKQLGKTGDTALANTEKQSVQSLKSQLMDWLEKKNPAYESARSEFAAASKPINQMEVGQYLEQKLVPALSDEAKQRAAAYAQALRDAPGTIKKATGQPRFEGLNRIMNPDQLETLRGVQSDLAREASVQDMARRGMSAATESAYGVVPQIPPTGMFNPKLSMARGLYNRFTGQATDKIMADLAKNMDNPQKMAEIMKAAKPFERQALVDALMRYQGGVPAAVQGANQ